MGFITNKIYFGAPKQTPAVQALNKAAAAQQGMVKVASRQAIVQKEAAFPAGHEDKFEKNKFKGKGEGDSKKDEKKDGKEKDACDEKMAAAKPKPKAAAVVVANQTTKATVKVAEDEKKSEKGEETYDAGKTEAKLTNDPEMPTDTTAAATKMTGGDKKPEHPTGESAGTKGVTTYDEGKWEGKPANNNKPEMPTEKNVVASGEDALKQILAMLEQPMTKTANMKPELKKRTREYLLSVFPAAYVDAMLADK